MTVCETRGQSAPLGATVANGGVNFCLFSRNATRIELLLFDRDDDARPSRVVRSVWPRDEGISLVRFPESKRVT